MTEPQTLPERLNDLARRTEMRIGNHPDAELCREGAKHILAIEAQLAVETNEAQPKVRGRGMKKEPQA